MKKIKFILISILASMPITAKALMIISPNDSSGNAFSFQSNSPILMFLNITAFFALTFSLITFMQGYTKYDLASGNYDDLEQGKKTMAISALVLLYVVIVFIIDLNSYK